MERMAEQHQHDKPTATPAATAAPAQEVTGEEVVYGQVGGKPVRGYLARPKGVKALLPGLIVIHEWWGLNDNVRKMAERLAGEGYTALAVDLYGGQSADTPEKAQALMGAVLKNTPPAEENLKQAYAFLETRQKAPGSASSAGASAAAGLSRPPCSSPKKSTRLSSITATWSTTRPNWHPSRCPSSASSAARTNPSLWPPCRASKRR